MGAVALRAPRLATGPAVRLGTTLALGAFAAVAWARMLRPADPAPLLVALGGGALLAGVALAAWRLPRLARTVVLLAVAPAGCTVALLTAGVPIGLLDPRAWDELVVGVGQGLVALPSVAVPYGGIDEWVRSVLLLGGTGLLVVAPVLAVWPGFGGTWSRGAVVIALGVAVAVPAVQVPAERPMLDGVLIAMLLAAVLWLDRVARRSAPAAGAMVAVGVLLAILAAPRLDADRPWIDVREVARSLADDRGTAFRWDHGYGPLHWPRDGRELLRIRARSRSYWKTTNLSQFDGLRWRSQLATVDHSDTELAGRRSWYGRVRVTVRGLRSRHFVGAGTTLEIRRSPRPVMAGASGSFRVADRPLRPGHAYEALVYSPRPTTDELASAGTDYPVYVRDELTLGLPGPELGVVRFPAWGSDAPVLGYLPRRAAHDLAGDEMLEASPYRRAWRLAQRLRAGAASPHAYVKRVMGHLERGFSYTETPRQAEVPLDAFLFRDRKGYCQHFSGAMAMLLRMGGIPARVAVGFSPGTPDARRREFVVRDLDAHSWVEAYFPRIGWVTFDPTPAVAPPRLQASGTESNPGAATDEESPGRDGPVSERAGEPLSASPSAGPGQSGRSPAQVVGGGLLALAGVSAGLVVWRRRRPPPDAFSELVRALRRTGRRPPVATTLRGLEQRLAGSPGARAYLQTVRDQRYGFSGGAPTAAQRRALRRELASGTGLPGRLRSWWALPPRLR